jgi:hypothetical protein
MPRKKAQPEEAIKAGRRPDMDIGRDLMEKTRRQNEMMTDQLQIGQTVQYYAEGWRIGNIDRLPIADEKRYGEVRVVHKMTGTVWVDGRDVRPLTMDWDTYYRWLHHDDPISEQNDASDEPVPTAAPVQPKQRRAAVKESLDEQPDLL